MHQFYRAVGVAAWLVGALTAINLVGIQGLIRAVHVGACNHSGACSQTARLSAHACCDWRGAPCSNYLLVCSPSAGAACKRALCSRSMPMGSPNPPPADSFAKRVSRTVLTSGEPQKGVAVMVRQRDRQKGRFSRTAGGARNGHRYTLTTEPAVPRWPRSSRLGWYFGKAITFPNPTYATEAGTGPRES